MGGRARGGCGFTGGFVAGLLDIVYAFTVYGRRPLTILQSIVRRFRSREETAIALITRWPLDHSR